MDDSSDNTQEGAASTTSSCFDVRVRPLPTRQQQQHQLLRSRSNSSSPSPSTSGRATPASLGAASAGSAGSSGSSHHHQQQAFQQNYQYLTQTHNYFVRSQDAQVSGVGHNYLHTFPSAANQSHYFQQQHQQHYHTQYATHHPQAHLMSPYMQQHHQQQQQQHSLPPLYATSHSLNSSPLLTKRAISFSGNMPLSRQQMESGLGSPANAFQRSQATAQSTPNSPRLMPRRTQKPPPIPAKPPTISSGTGFPVPQIKIHQ
ncbi:putative uncharacterized protein DDB_G0291608 [Musca vetustissima]|uniref:putative uncharacterized protein DDB_G0291608 n=1 Tax=Musca vetustissima TaxID=27455 RepID=UPI002AB74717|nr:putative uncharacterized protein DDB_G0291608 [Musca vetustissima]